MTASLTVSGLTHRFDDRVVLDRLDLTVAADEAVAIVGPSGCGKSTLLRVIAGLMPPTEGRVEIDGVSVAGQTGHAAFMPQTDALLPWRRALDNAILGAQVSGADRRAARERARTLFARFGLDGFETAWPSELSGGMRQRVAFLRTILSGHGVLLLDEPFGALDAMTRSDLHGWFGDLLVQEPRTLLLVTHDTDDALRLVDRVVVMSPRPGRTVATLDIPGERPRSALRLLDADMADVKRRILLALAEATAPHPSVAEEGDDDRRSD